MTTLLHAIFESASPHASVTVTFIPPTDGPAVWIVRGCSRQESGRVITREFAAASAALGFAAEVLALGIDDFVAGAPA